jgi:hypothetical protein
VPRRVGDDEASAGGGEIPVRDVDGDRLLALGAQPVGDEGQVRRRTPCLATQRVELVVLDGPRVEQKAPDQRRLAVVDTARSRESQQVRLGVRGRPGNGWRARNWRAQKYPSRFFCSMEPSWSWSITRVTRSE